MKYLNLNLNNTAFNLGFTGHDFQQTQYKCQNFSKNFRLFHNSERFKEYKTKWIVRSYFITIQWKNLNLSHLNIISKRNVCRYRYSRFERCAPPSHHAFHALWLNDGRQGCFDFSVHHSQKNNTNNNKMVSLWRNSIQLSIWRSQKIHPSPATERVSKPNGTQTMQCFLSKISDAFQRIWLCLCVCVCVVALRM